MIYLLFIHLFIEYILVQANPHFYSYERGINFILLVFNVMMFIFFYFIDLKEKKKEKKNLLNSIILFKNLNKIEKEKKRIATEFNICCGSTDLYLKYINLDKEYKLIYDQLVNISYFKEILMVYNKYYINHFNNLGFKAYKNIQETIDLVNNKNNT